MSRRAFVERTATAVAGLSVANPMQREGLGVANARPNILFILSDDHSVPHLSCYGDPNLQTPTLDALAADGMRFNRAYTTAPQCAPSRSSFASGRSAVDTRMTRFSAPLPADVVTYHEVLREHGYHTGICGRSYHLDGSGRMPPETRHVFDEHGLRTFHRRVDFLRSDSNPDTTLEHMREFLDQVPEGRPFSLQVNYSDPHRPFTATDHEPNPESLELPPSMPDTPLLREDLAGYYGEVQRVDGEIARILALLDERGLAENTLVAFVGDNGAALLRGKGTLYETGLNVPLLVRWPGRVEPGSVSDDLISGEDLAPTFLQAAGAPVPEEMTGVSFLMRLQGEEFEGRRYLFGERGAHGSGLPMNTGAFDLGRCVIGQRHKLIYNALWQLPYTPVDFAGGAMWKDLRKRHDAGTLGDEFSRALFSEQRPMFQVFDLEADPYEFNNLAGNADGESIEQELKAALQEWMILNEDYLPLPVPPGPRNGR